MGSEAPSFIQNLINSRNRDISLFFPFIFGLNPSNQPPEIDNRDLPDRIILVNPVTQGMLVIERSNSDNRDSSGDNSTSLGFDSFFNDLFTRKLGRPPASRASIEAMASVEIEGNDDEQCVICLEDWEIGEKVKEMPCKHRFHGGCIEKWLKIHGSCPVCRYEMPVEEGDEKKRESDEERRREIWVTFTFSSDQRRGNGDDNQHSNDQEIQG